MADVKAGSIFNFHGNTPNTHTKKLNRVNTTFSSVFPGYNSLLGVNFNQDVDFFFQDGRLPKMIIAENRCVCYISYGSINLTYTNRSFALYFNGNWPQVSQ